MKTTLRMIEYKKHAGYSIQAINAVGDVVRSAGVHPDYKTTTTYKRLKVGDANLSGGVVRWDVVTPVGVVLEKIPVPGLR